MYQGRRKFFRLLQKYPAFDHNNKFIGYFRNIDHCKEYLKNQDSQILVTHLVLTKYLGFREDIGFIRKFLIIPTVIKN